MATFASLTADQKRIVTDDLRNVRAALGQLAKVLNQLAALDANWAAQTQAIATLLDSTEIVADNTGLAGASPITAAQYMAAWSAIQTNILATMNTGARRQTYSLFAGPLNTVG